MQSPAVNKPSTSYAGKHYQLDESTGTQVAETAKSDFPSSNQTSNKDLSSLTDKPEDTEHEKEKKPNVEYQQV